MLCVCLIRFKRSLSVQVTIFIFIELCSWRGKRGISDWSVLCAIGCVCVTVCVYLLCLQALLDAYLTSIFLRLFSFSFPLVFFFSINLIIGVSSEQTLNFSLIVNYIANAFSFFFYFFPKIFIRLRSTRRYLSPMMDHSHMCVCFWGISREVHALMAFLRMQSRKL